MSTEDLLRYHAALCYRPGDPSQIDEVADVDVLGRDVPAPRPAGQGQSVGKAVADTASSFIHILVDHNPSGLSSKCQGKDMIITAAVNTASMACPLIGSDPVDEVDRISDAWLIAVKRKNDRQLLT